MKRLSTDQSLAAFAGQFVPLKLTTDGNPEWSKWARRYRHEGGSIPIIYVIRADGEKLYARSGSLQGNELPQMLATVLQQAGRTFSNAETALLTASVEEAKSAVNQEDYTTAAKSLGRLAELGSLGKLSSFSSLALEADKLVQQTQAQGRNSLSQAQKKLENPKTAFDGVLSLLEAETAYSAFGDLKKEIGAALREVQRNKALKEPIQQAESVLRARRYAASSNASTRKQAIRVYEQVITRFSGSPAETVARRELASLSPDSAILKTPSAAPDENAFRTWTDKTGTVKIEAKYVQQKQGHVQLQKPDGSLIATPISLLSEADQEYLKTQE